MRILLLTMVIMIAGVLQACGSLDGRPRSRTETEQSSQFLRIIESNDFDNKLEASDPIKISGKTNVHIARKRITNPNGPCIIIDSSANITIESSSIGPCAGEAIVANKSSNIVVRNNYIKKARAGLYAYKSQRIQFHNNHVTNVIGGKPRGQMVQFNQVDGEGNLIKNNIAINALNESEPEDIINMYKSSGTAQSPILIQDNYIRGGGPSKSGGGIMLGDSGGSHQKAVGNILIDPGQYGIAVASGSDMLIADNQVYAKRQSFTNVGLYAWDQTSNGCRNTSIVNNRVGYTKATGQNSPIWIHNNCASAQVTGNSVNEPYRTPEPDSSWGPSDQSLEVKTISRRQIKTDTGHLWKMGEACVEPIGDKLGIADCSENPSKRWLLTFSSVDEVSVKNKGKNLCLTINKAENGSPLRLAACNNLETQKFKHHYGDIVYIDKFCADLNVKTPSMEFDWNANVINLWECAGTWNQKWHFDY